MLIDFRERGERKEREREKPQSVTFPNQESNPQPGLLQSIEPHQPGPPQCYVITSSTCPVLVFLCHHLETLEEVREALILKSVLLNKETKRPVGLVTGCGKNSWVHPKLPWHLTQTEGKCLAEKQRRTLSAENPFCAHTADKLCWVMQLFWGQWCFVNSWQSGFVRDFTVVWSLFTDKNYMEYKGTSY